MSAQMTKGEREDLQRLLRQREKVQKSAARQRSAELLADFDNQLAAEYRFDDDAVWAEVARHAQVEIDKAQELVAARCVELGIPREFAPSLNLEWAHRGYGNSVKQRREELRRAAKTRIEAMESKALVIIEQSSVEGQTKLAMAGVTSEGALAFMSELPSVEKLMERLSFAELSGRSNPPIASQLIAPVGLRPEPSGETALLSDGGAA